MNKVLYLCAGGVLVSAFGYLVWPTPYRYTTYAGSLPMRIDRISGDAEVLRYVEKGWEGNPKPINFAGSHPLKAKGGQSQ